MAGLAAAAVLAPFVAAVLGMLLGRRLPGGPAAIAVLGTLVSAVAAWLLARSVIAEPDALWEYSTVLTPTGALPVTLGVRVDALSAAVAAMVPTVALAIQVFSAGYLRQDRRYSSFAALVSLFTAAMLTVVLAGDLLVLYVGWEVMGICSYFLIGHHWEQRANSAAAVKSFLMTRFGDVWFLFGIFVLGVATGSLRISDVLAAAPTLPAGTVLAATLLLTAGIVGKSAQFPLHSWLPDAMAGPAPVSALIHAATMVAAGAYVVARLYPAFQAAPRTLDVIAVLAVLSMIGAALAALATDDLKRVLAYSTISQLSIMFVALAVGGRTEAIAHLLSHAAFKALLFLGAGVVIHTAASTLMAEHGGLWRAMPVTFATMTIGFAALAGLPPTSGFFTKDAVLAAAVHGSGWAATLVTAGLLVTAALTAAYATRAWLRTFFGAARQAAHEPSWVQLAPLVVLAAAALLLGLLGLRAGQLHVELGSAAVSVALAGLGGAAVYALWRRAPQRDPADVLGRARPLLASALRTDDLYERTVAVAVLRAARAVLGTDERVLGRSVTGTGRGARTLGGVLRLAQNGNAQFYVTGVLAGVLLIAVGVAVLS